MKQSKDTQREIKILLNNAKNMQWTCFDIRTSFLVSKSIILTSKKIQDTTKDKFSLVGNGLNKTEMKRHVSTSFLYRNFLFVKS